jgi:hypothetical protein
MVVVKMATRQRRRMKVAVVIVEKALGMARVPQKSNPTHVVGARSRVVSEPDGKVLHLQGLLLVDLFGTSTKHPGL